MVRNFKISSDNTSFYVAKMWLYRVKRELDVFLTVSEGSSL